MLNNTNSVAGAHEAVSAHGVLCARNLAFHYPCKKGRHHWVFRHLSLELPAHEVTVLYGGSGGGKTTLAKVLAGYERPLEGDVLLDGESLFAKSSPGLHRSQGQFYRPIQLIHQNPEKAVNPRLRMRRVLKEGYDVPVELARRLGIEEAWLERFAPELSGGELQRFCIARALGPAARYIICDEISAMFDPVTQAQIWQVLLEENRSRGIGILAITHDHSLAARLSDRRINIEDLIHAPPLP
jgi:peptide/nickel transport system ATP-binding protein